MGILKVDKHKERLFNEHVDYRRKSEGFQWIVMKMNDSSLVWI